ncbi:MAG: hypothetical protein PHC88_03595 [Terrimicrobiaceae bacterium]|nr:hypothetical protein [Terrimicrobiaceae bacterium]
METFVRSLVLLLLTLCSACNGRDPGTELNVSFGEADRQPLLLDVSGPKPEEGRRARQ